MAHHLLLQVATTTLLIILFLAPPTTASTVVLDVEGNPLEPGSQYYVLTVGRGAAGRGDLIYASKPNQLCPTYVGHYRLWAGRGNPVIFYTSDPSQTQVNESDNINISFGPGNFCRDSGVWKLTIDESTNVPFISTNGVIGDLESGQSWFKLEKSNSGSGYKIVYCQQQQSSYKEDCQQLDGIESGSDRLNWLSLVPIDEPLGFIGFAFGKVSIESTSS